MSFDLFPSLTPFLVFLAVVALAAVGAGLAGVVTFATTNHRERLARHESLRHYYGHLVLGH